MKDRGFVILVGGMIGFSLIGAIAEDFISYQNTQIVESKIEVENPFSEALPYDFWGDYSHPEFWEDKATHEIVWSNPFSDDYYHHKAYKGMGNLALKLYTGEYNFAVKNGYAGKYTGFYKDFATSKENINGFYKFEPDWSLLWVSMYLEDWIVWNCNEVQAYDGLVNREITNEDINLEWNGNSIHDNLGELNRVNLKNYRNFADGISIGNPSTSNYQYHYYFVQQPLNDAGEDIGTSPRKDWTYFIYPLERLILDENEPKISALGKINTTEAHQFIKAYDFTNTSTFVSETVNENEYYQANASRLSGFEFQTNKLIYEWVNRKSALVEAFGWDYVRANDYLLSSTKQNYQTGFVSQNDFDVTYKVSTDQINWFNANTKGDHVLKDADGLWVYEPDPLDYDLTKVHYLKIIVKFKDTSRTITSKISELFDLTSEWDL